MALRTHAPETRAWRLKAAHIGPLLVSILATLWYYSSFHRRRAGNEARRIIIPLSGRLGNQLFQFAAADYIHRQTGITPGFLANLYGHDTVYTDSLFNKSAVFPNLKTACKGHKIRDEPPVSTDCRDLDAALLDSPCLHLRGLFQCHKIAAVGLPAVCSQLARLPQQSSAVSTVERLHRLYPARPLVTLHVRRGDYTKKFNRNLLEPLPLVYYRKAMERMPSNSVFMIFSDDLAWCKQTFKGDIERGKTLKFMRFDDPLEALLTMAMATHYIIAKFNLQLVEGFPEPVFRKDCHCTGTMVWTTNADRN